MIQPDNFNFRLRFNLSKSFRLQSEVEELPLLATTTGQAIKVKSGISAVPLRDAERVAVIGGPFDTEGAARAAGMRAKDATLLWALEQRVGIDFGDGISRGLATDEGLKLLSSQHNAPVRNDVHGVDVYRADGKTKFVYVAADAVAGKNAENFVNTFRKEFESAKPLDERHVLAAELYFSSWFDVSPRSRFITLMTAVEALLEPAPRDSATNALVSKLVETTKKGGVPPQVKDSIRGALSWLNYESISQAGRRTADALLPTENFSGLTAGAFFRRAYDIRSQIVHRGFANPVLIMDLGNTMEEFASKILRASVNHPGVPGSQVRSSSFRKRLRAAWLAFRDS